DRVGVGVQHLDLLQGHPQLLGRDLRERGLVALAEGGGAAAHERGAVLADRPAAPLGPDPGRGHLHVDGDPDPHLHAAAGPAAPRRAAPGLELSGLMLVTTAVAAKWMHGMSSAPDVIGRVRNDRMGALPGEAPIAAGSCRRSPTSRASRAAASSTAWTCPRPC